LDDNYGVLGGGCGQGLLDHEAIEVRAVVAVDDGHHPGRHLDAAPGEAQQLPGVKVKSRRPRREE
jgi:hypothetical protein